SEVGTEAEADQRDQRAREPAGLAGDEQGHDDGEVAHEPEHRHRDSRELRVVRALHLLAAAAGQADGRPARVVLVGDVARHTKADERDDADRVCQPSVSHVPSAASSFERRSPTEGDFSFTGCCPAFVTTIVGVDLTPSLLASPFASVSCLATASVVASCSSFATSTPAAPPIWRRNPAFT